MIPYNKTPFLLRILIELYGWVVAVPLVFIFELSRLTCSFELEGLENLEKHPHAIWACWHEFVICSFVTLPILKRHSRHQVWLNHPVWTMRPTHRIMDYYGVDVVMGASGAHGRAAAVEVLKRLRDGESTSINPDGPAGPKHQLKSGVLNLARESGLPILAIRYQVSRSWTWPGWDRKIVPAPFAKVRVLISAPLFIGAKDDARDQLTELLS